MSDRKHFTQKEKELELIEAFETFSLYYDRKDKSLWVWDGENFVGISAESLYKDLLFTELLYKDFKDLFS